MAFREYFTLGFKIILPDEVVERMVKYYGQLENVGTLKFSRSTSSRQVCLYTHNYSSDREEILADINDYFRNTLMAKRLAKMLPASLYDEEYDDELYEESEEDVDNEDEQSDRHDTSVNVRVNTRSQSKKVKNARKITRVHEEPAVDVANIDDREDDVSIISIILLLLWPHHDCNLTITCNHCLIIVITLVIVIV